ncbi:MAG: DUF523 domain-containing protein [Oscillospiraceae bacterium]
MNILVSACLLGIMCRYDGSCVVNQNLEKLREKHRLVPVCPEIYGGLKTPREPCEIVGDRVLTISGKDVTTNFVSGAQEILKLAKFFDCQYAILKERSPSCGYKSIYDGTFSGKLIEGNGITAALLADNGIPVIGESSIEQLLNK